MNWQIAFGMLWIAASTCGQTPAFAQTDGPDLPTTTAWLLEKLNKSQVQLDWNDGICRDSGSQVQQASVNGLILHIHQVSRTRCILKDNNVGTKTRVYDIDVPLYAIDSTSVGEAEAIPFESRPGNVPAVYVNTAKNDVVTTWSTEDQFTGLPESDQSGQQRGNFARIFVHLDGEDNADLAKRMVKAFERARDLTKAMRPKSNEPF